MRFVELSNNSNWQSLYSTSVTGGTIRKDDGESVPIPIPPVTILFLLDSFILAVSVNTAVPADATWYFAGYANQKILCLGCKLSATEYRKQYEVPLFDDATHNFECCISWMVVSMVGY